MWLEFTQVFLFVCFLWTAPTFLFLFSLPLVYYETYLNGMDIEKDDLFNKWCWHS